MPVEGRRRPAWAEVDLAALAHNAASLRDLVAPARLCAVVKADGYGHGARSVARGLLDGGASEDRPVETGITDGETTEIASGALVPGEKVVVRKDLNGSRWNNVNKTRPRSSSGGKH